MPAAESLGRADAAYRGILQRINILARSQPETAIGTATMPATAIDSAVFRNIFSTEAMRRIFSDESRVQKYLDFEAALARAQARLGIIPQEAAAEIERHCGAGGINFVKLETETARIGYPVLPVVQQLVALCRDGLGEWCHWGATTQDVTDSATVMQIREALTLIEADIDAIAAALAGLARKYRDTPMAGRSNLQQAVPITFGYKTATLLAAFDRHKQRLQELRARVLVGEFGGAAGTLASLGGRGLQVQAELMKELRLGVPAIAWHTTRDSIAEIGCFLGLLTGTCGKLAFDVKLMMQTEVEEVFEPFQEGRGSSSTMPQKRNPISSVYITALTSVVRQQVAALLDAMVGDHERATGPWEIEWIVLPEIFCLSAGALAQTLFVLTGLQVDEKKMRANLDLTKGLIVSEAVMMGLAPYLGRQYAHDLVYDICRKVIATGRPLVDLLAENEEVSKHLDRAALTRLCDPANYLGEAGAMVDRVLGMRGLRT
jgi:3-carboxy-cis,cis-muconate cycloisomerase